MDRSYEDYDVLPSGGFYPTAIATADALYGVGRWECSWDWEAIIQRHMRSTRRMPESSRIKRRTSVLWLALVATSLSAVAFVSRDHLRGARDHVQYWWLARSSRDEDPRLMSCLEDLYMGLPSRSRLELASTAPHEVVTATWLRSIDRFPGCRLEDSAPLATMYRELGITHREDMMGETWASLYRLLHGLPAREAVQRN